VFCGIIIVKMDILELLDELREDVLELLKRKERLEKLLARQGYSLKHINKNTYVYVWRYEEGKARWRCLGNVKKIGLPEKSSEVKELAQIEERLAEIRERLMEIKKMMG